LRASRVWCTGARAAARFATAARGPRCRPWTFAPDTELTLGQELGADHPLTTAIRVYGTLRVALATAAVLLLLAVFAIEFVDWRAESALIASGTAAVVFALAAAIARAVSSERALAVLARGERRSDAYLRLVAERLTSAAHTTAIANTLAHALWEAHHLEHIPIAKRPPPSTKQLCQAAAELETIIAALRAAAPVSAQAVALCDQLVRGGYSSQLYAGELPELRWQLRRIRFRLSDPT
jgi:hypothetical protein